MRAGKVSNISSTLDDLDQPYEAWKDMPKDAIDYLKSLPEFNADIFKRVTGIDAKVDSDCCSDCKYNYCPQCGCKLK